MSLLLINAVCMYFILMKPLFVGELSIATRMLHLGKALYYASNSKQPLR